MGEVCRYAEKVHYVALQGMELERKKQRVGTANTAIFYTILALLLLSLLLLCGTIYFKQKKGL